MADESVASPQGTFDSFFLEFMGHTITVVITEERPRIEETQELLDGCLDPAKEIVFIWKGLTEDRKREILAHELTHLVDLDTSTKGRLTENQVGRISRGFQGLLAENPDLAMFFARKIKTATLVKRLEKCQHGESDT